MRDASRKALLPVFTNDTGSVVAAWTKREAAVLLNQKFASKGRLLTHQYESDDFRRLKKTFDTGLPRVL